MQPAASPCPPDEPDRLNGWERALLDRQLEALNRLADMGMALAGAVERRVTAQEPGSGPQADLHHAAMDFARLSRAVRMTFALQSRLIADFKGKARAGCAEDVEPGEETYEGVWAEPPGAQRRRQVGRLVRRVAEASALDREGIERLLREAAERLERDDIYGGLDRPVGELVAQICQDLGLGPDWDGLGGEAWAQVELAAEVSGLPFAAWTAGRPPRPSARAASP